MRQKKKIYLAYNTLVKRSAEYICNTIYGYIGSKIQVWDQETTWSMFRLVSFTYIDQMI